MFKKIAVFYSIAVTIAVISFFAGKITTENRLMEQHRLELNAARERAAVLSDKITRAAETNRELGESLSRQRTSVAELRKLISEVRTKYEKWKNCSIVLGTTTVTLGISTAVLILVMANK